MSEWEPKPKIRGSAFNAGLVCSGSVFLAQQSAEEGIDSDNQYTKVGTIGHRYLELRIKHGATEAEDYLDDLKVEQPFRVELCGLWDWLEEAAFLPALSCAEAEARGVSLITEYALSYQAGPVTITGTLDLISVDEAKTHATVCDWKFYNRPEMLPPITADMQMLAYAVGAAKALGVESVSVYRVLCYHQRFAVFHLDAEILKIAAEAVEEEATGIWNTRNVLRPGAQCRGCFQAPRCPALDGAAKAVETTEIAPYVGGHITSAEDVCRFLIAVPLVERRISEGLDAARRYVEAHGPITDPASGMIWGPESRKQDEIVDAGGCLAHLQAETSEAAALEAMSTTKGAMERALKAAKRRPAARAEFFAELREQGLIERNQTRPRWEWRKPRRSRDGD